MEEALKDRYYREYPLAGGRKIRVLTVEGFNLVRSMVGLPEASPSAWLALTPEEKAAFRKETLMRATPDLVKTLFGPDADPEGHPIDE
jgi:hypothetical protein